MKPTINMNVKSADIDGDSILINKYQKGTTNDIVVAKVDWPTLDGDYVIKRLVGMPGDKIEIKDHETHFSLYVNDEILYSKEKTGENSNFLKTGSIGYYAKYISFLENPNFSRNVEIIGNSTYIRLHENDYFLMGDNWGQTLDCIAEGPIKKSDIVGRVDLIVDVTNHNPFTYFNFFMKNIFFN